MLLFSNNGPFSEKGNRYPGKLDNGKLIFTGPARFQYELDSDGKIKVKPDGTITINWWIRDNSGKWQSWMTNTFAKVE